MYLCMVGFCHFAYSVPGSLFIVLFRLLDDILIFIGVAHPSRFRSLLGTLVSSPRAVGRFVDWMIVPRQMEFVYISIFSRNIILR